jgi:hypothetical protein
MVPTDRLNNREPKTENRKERNDPLVHIVTALNEPVVRMWSEILENEGRRSLVRSRDPLMAAMYNPSNTPCEIHVLTSRAETAKEILATFSESDNIQEVWIIQSVPLLCPVTMPPNPGRSITTIFIYNVITDIEITCQKQIV